MDEYYNYRLFFSIMRFKTDRVYIVIVEHTGMLHTWVVGCSVCLRRVSRQRGCHRHLQTFHQALLLLPRALDQLKNEFHIPADKAK